MFMSGYIMLMCGYIMFMSGYIMFMSGYIMLMSGYIMLMSGYLCSCLDILFMYGIAYTDLYPTFKLYTNGLWSRLSHAIVQVQ